MIQQNRWVEYQTAALFLAACLILLIVIFFEWSLLQRNDSNTAAGIQGSSNNWFGEVPDPAEELQMSEEYQVITQRPLFFQSRRPIEAGGEELDSFTGKLELILTGVIVSPEGLSVLIRDKENQSYHLKQGEDINGWVVDAVYGHKIVLKKDGKQKAILLRDVRKREKKNAQLGVMPSPIAVSKQQKKRIEKNEPK